MQVVRTDPPRAPKTIRQRWKRSGPRRILEERMPLLWSRGGAQDDSLVAYPLSIAADSAHVFVFDMASASLIALHAATGAPRWRFGRRGSGPGEFSSYVQVAITPRGEVLTVDWSNLRLSYIHPDSGTILRVERWEEKFGVRSACVTASSNLVVYTADPDLPLRWLGPSYAAPERHPWPWPDMAGLPGVVSQSVIVGGPTGDCILAVRYGHGFARYSERDGAPAYVREYVERTPLPQPDVRRLGDRGAYEVRLPRGAPKAAHAVAVSRDEVFIAFGGRSEWRGRLVDRYGLSDGLYSSSLLLERSPHGMAVSAGRLFVIDMEDHFPAVRAYRVPPG